MRDPAAFRAWRFGVTRWVLAQHRREAWVRKWLPGASVERASAAPTPGEDPDPATTTSPPVQPVELLPAEPRPARIGLLALQVPLLLEVDRPADALTATDPYLTQGIVLRRDDMEALARHLREAQTLHGP